MQTEADKNFYLFKAIVVGAQKTGKTTFIRQMLNGSPDDKEQVNQVYYKSYDRIGGKLRVMAEIQDMPEEVLSNGTISQAFFSYKAILFVFFDLSRPATFFRSSTAESPFDVQYFMNEASTINKNRKLMRFLIGTNADKADRKFDRLDAE